MRNARFVLLAISSLLAGAFFTSCTSSEPAGVYAFVQWRVRCENMRCGSPRPNRCVDGFDNDEPVDPACTRARVSCNVIENDAGRTLSFNVAANEFGLQVTSATFARGGSTPSGPGCQVRVVDDNTYVGACGSAPPSETQPCQITNVSFARDEEGRARIRGNLYCVGISPSAAPQIDREVTASGNTSEDATRPLTFDLYDCPGYEPD